MTLQTHRALLQGVQSALPSFKAPAAGFRGLGVRV